MAVAKLCTFQARSSSLLFDRSRDGARRLLHTAASAWIAIYTRNRDLCIRAAALVVRWRCCLQVVFPRCLSRCASKIDW